MKRKIAKENQSQLNDSKIAFKGRPNRIDCQIDQPFHPSRNAPKGTADAGYNANKNVEDTMGAT